MPCNVRILSCILLKFYIKPQLEGGALVSNLCCILLKFYIKPQLDDQRHELWFRCILLKFYIKPQQCPISLSAFQVVSY